MSYDMQYAEKHTMFLINQMWNIDYVRLFWATEPEWIDLMACTIFVASALKT